jgi:hypothetical protein
MSEQRSGQQTISDVSALPFTAPDGAKKTVSSWASDVDKHVSGWVNVKSYGAKGDGSTDDTAAIRSAIAAAKASTKHVRFPTGTFLVSDNFSFDSTHSGMTIAGDGPSSVIKFANTLNAGNVEAGWMFLVRDTVSTVRNLTIRDLRLDGSRSTITWATTSHGVVVTSGTLLDNVHVSRVTAHGFRYQGFLLSSGPVRLSDSFAYDNGFHGVAISGTSDTPPVEVYNVTSEENGQYGFDANGGSAVISNFVARGNIAGGAKYAGDVAHLSVVNAVFESNDGLGFQGNGLAPDTANLFLDNIVCRWNGSAGININGGGRVTAGKLISYGNNGASLQYDVAFTSLKDVRVDSILVADSTTHGVYVGGSVERYSIGHLHAENNHGAAIRVRNAGTSPTHGEIGGGIIRNNNLDGVAGNAGAAVQVIIDGTTKIGHVVFQDDQTVPTQTSGFYFAGGVEAEVRDCHFGTGIVDGQQVWSGNTGTRVRFGGGNTGIVTRVRGTYTANGGSTSHNATFPTAMTTLAAAVYFAQVTPASADAKGDHYVGTVTTTTLPVTYGTATTAGTNNVSLQYDVELEIQR